MTGFVKGMTPWNKGLKLPYREQPRLQLVPKPPRSMPEEKWCKACEAWKPRAEFYRRYRSPRGRIERCISCEKAKVNVRYKQGKLGTLELAARVADEAAAIIDRAKDKAKLEAGALRAAMKRSANAGFKNAVETVKPSPASFWEFLRTSTELMSR